MLCVADTRGRRPLPPSLPYHNSLGPCGLAKGGKARRKDKRERERERERQTDRQRLTETDRDRQRERASESARGAWVGEITLYLIWFVALSSC